MINNQSKNITDILPEYIISTSDILNLISEVVTKHYGVSRFELESKWKNQPIARARRMFYMFALNLTDVSYTKLAERFNQKHCMVCHARKLLVDINQQWNKDVLDSYMEINLRIEALIRQRFFKKLPEKRQPDSDMLIILSAIEKTVVAEPMAEELDQARQRFLKIISMWTNAERIGMADDALQSLLKYNDIEFQQIFDEPIPTPVDNTP
jgi:hypothetical protein